MPMSLGSCAGGSVSSSSAFDQTQSLMHEQATQKQEIKQMSSTSEINTKSSVTNLSELIKLLEVELLTVFDDVEGKSTSQHNSVVDADVASNSDCCALEKRLIGLAWRQFDNIRSGNFVEVLQQYVDLNLIDIDGESQSECQEQQNNADLDQAIRKGVAETVGNNKQTRSQSQSVLFSQFVDFQTLLASVAAFQIYNQCNVTGPSEQYDMASFRTLYAQIQFTSTTSVSFLPKYAKSNDSNEDESDSDPHRLLEIDGEMIYEDIKWAKLLLLSNVLLEKLDEQNGDKINSKTLWQGRVAFAWQRSLIDANERGDGHSNQLKQKSVYDFAYYLFGESRAVELGFIQGQLEGADNIKKEQSTPLSNKLDLDQVPAEVSSMLICELTVRACWYQCVKSECIQQLLKLASEAIGFSYEFTGVKGIRRKHQTHATAQLVVTTQTKARLRSNSSSAISKNKKQHYDEIKESLKLESSYFSWLQVGDGEDAIEEEVEEGDSDLEDLFGDLGGEIEKKGNDNDNDKNSSEQTADEQQQNNEEDAAAEEPALEDSLEKQLKKPTINPKSISLDQANPDNDILEQPKLKEAEEKEKEIEVKRAQEEPLEAPEQCILLAHCHYLWTNHTKNNELMLQEIGALCDRILVTEQPKKQGELAEDEMLTANWLVFSAGLWFRCKAESHRSHTRERACLQLQQLADQFADKIPSNTARLQYVSVVGYPFRHDLQRELGLRMMKYGMVMTAYQLFLKLKMWNESVDCLIAGDRRADAISLIHERLDLKNTAVSARCRLLCCLGDLATQYNQGDCGKLKHSQDPEQYYIEAWELSRRRYARAQRSLGWFYFQLQPPRLYQIKLQQLQTSEEFVNLQNDENAMQQAKRDLHMQIQDQCQEKAAEAYEKALKVNPVFPSIWFSLGCVQMRNEQFQKAVVSFTKSLAYSSGCTQENESPDTYGNLAACYARVKNFKDAKKAIQEACRRSQNRKNDWRLWESNLSINLHLRDVPGCCQAIKKLVVELGQRETVKMGVYGLLVKSVLDIDGDEQESGNADGNCAHQQETETEIQIKEETEDKEAVDGIIDQDDSTTNTKKTSEQQIQDEKKQNEKNLSRFITNVHEMLIQVTDRSITTEPYLYRLMAIIECQRNFHDQAWESRMKEYRQLQSPLWEDTSRNQLMYSEFNNNSVRKFFFEQEDQDQEQEQVQLGEQNKTEQDDDDVLDPAKTVFGQHIYDLLDNIAHMTEMIENKHLSSMKKKQMLASMIGNSEKKIKMKHENLGFGVSSDEKFKILLSKALDRISVMLDKVEKSMLEEGK